jgi:membrane fusion protein (multidrug efflux system)
MTQAALSRRSPLAGDARLDADHFEVPADSSPRLIVPAKRTSRAKFVLLGLVLAFAGIGGGAYAFGAGKETTDDAFVEGHVANVATRVQGQVVRVLVKDNQEVEAGDTLVELDDRDAKARLATARADLSSATAALASADANLALTSVTIDANLRQAKGGVSQAVATTATTRAGIDQAGAEVAVAQSRLDYARLEKDRSAKLFTDGAIGQADLDSKTALFDQAAATLEQARARKTSAEGSLSNATGTTLAAEGRLLAAKAGPQQVDVARAQVDVARARVDQAKAAVDQAELNLEYTRVTAPIHGVVSRRTVELGQTVDPSRPLLSLTNLGDVWVVANFKEDQLAHMQPGQRVKLRIDTFGHKDLPAHVDSISGGTGSRFALLPPDNASGNFTKVVQRVPVLVRLDDPAPAFALRPGMSADVTVYTGS